MFSSTLWRIEDLFLFCKDLFVYFSFGCTGSALLCSGFSLVAAIRGCSSLWCEGVSWRWPLFRSTGLGGTGFSSCSTHAQQLQLPGSVVVARGLSCSRTRDQTHAPCIGRLIPKHWATREALQDLGLTLIHCYWMFITSLWLERYMIWSTVKG